MTKIMNILVIGAGLIGGSIGLGLKKNGFCSKLGFIDNNTENLNLAKTNGQVDWVSDNLADTNDFKPQIIIVATPTLCSENIIKQLLGLVASNIVITDVASTKSNLAIIQAENYIPGHPIAGRERSGFQAAEADLFVNAKVILTPSRNINNSNKFLNKNIKLVTDMWSSLGANIITMDADLHDKVFAYTSHLPHLVAYSLVGTLLKTDISENIFDFAAGGLKDFTRVAASDPVMWHDICITNKDQLLLAITDFEASIAELKQAVEHGDSSAIMGIFTRAKNFKLKI